jgi:predicted nucleic acid-binding protein
LHVLNELFGQVGIPQTVERELFQAPVGTRGLEDIKRAIDRGWLHVYLDTADSARSSGSSLGPGEIAALLLVKELGADLLITDDAAARREATRRNIPAVGTVGVLAAARDEALIPAVVPLLHELRRFGQWIGDDLIARVQSDESKHPS